MKNHKIIGLVRVTTTMPRAMRDECRSRGITIQSLIMRGFQSLDGKQIVDRQEDLREKIDRLALTLARTQERLWNLEKEKD